MSRKVGYLIGDDECPEDTINDLLYSTLGRDATNIDYYCAPDGLEFYFWLSATSKAEICLK